MSTGYRPTDAWLAVADFRVHGDSIEESEGVIAAFTYWPCRRDFGHERRSSGLPAREPQPHRVFSTATSGSRCLGGAPALSGVDAQRSQHPTIRPTGSFRRAQQEGRGAKRVFRLSRLRNSWGFRLGAVLNSPGEHPFALDRRLDAGSGGPAARREVEVGLFRRVADRAPGHGWVTDAHRAPKGRCRRCAGYVTRRTSWSAVSASTPNMQ